MFLIFSAWMSAIFLVTFVSIYNLEEFFSNSVADNSLLNESFKGCDK